MSLYRKTITNLSIMMLFQIIVLILSQLAMILLAKMLDPVAFGIYAIVLIVYNLAILLSTFGMDLASIQSNEDSDTVLRTGLAIRCILTAATICILIPISPIIADFFSRPELTLPLITVSLSLAAAVLGFAPLVILFKELKFLSISISRLAFSVVWPLAAILLALFNYGYWSLVIAFFLGNLAMNLFFVFFSKRRIRPKLDNATAKRLIAYGKFPILSSIFVFLVFNMDKVAIGKILNPDLLGIYFIAFSWGTMVPTIFTNSLSSVMFPTYVKIVDDRILLARAYQKTMKYAAYLSMPVGFGFAAISSVFIQSTLGTRWIDAITPLAILSFVGIAQSMVTPSWSIFMSIGKPEIETYQTLIVFVPFILLLFPVTTTFGLVGVSSLVLISSIAWMMMGAWRASILLDMRPIDIFSQFLKPFIAACIMTLIVLTISMFFMPTLFTLAIEVLTGIATYILLLHILTKGEAIDEAKHMLRTILSK